MNKKTQCVCCARQAIHGKRESKTPAALVSDQSLIASIGLCTLQWLCYVAAKCVEISFVGHDVHAARCLVLLNLHHSSGHRLLRALPQLPRGRPRSGGPRRPRRRPGLAPLPRLLERADGRRGDRPVALRLQLLYLLSDRSSVPPSAATTTLWVVHFGRCRPLVIRSPVS